MRPAASACVVATTALVLLGCTEEPEPEIPEQMYVQLNPVGDPGRWIHDEYADGVAGEYTTGNTICGISDQIIVEMEEQDSGAYRIIGRSLPEGETLWEEDGAMCPDRSVMGDTVLIGDSEPPEFEQYRDNWRLVDFGTGEVLRELDLVEEGLLVRPVTEVDDLLVVTVDSGTLVGFGSDGIEWRTEDTGAVWATVLGDGYIGLEGGSSWIMMVNGSTGEITLPETEMGRRFWEWASDGYVVEISEENLEYAFVDLHGNEIDRRTGEYQARFWGNDPVGPGFPWPVREAITFPLADHLEAPGVVAVDAEGMPVLLWDEDFPNTYTRDGLVNGLETGLYLPTAVSADGSIILTDGRDRSGFSIRDAAGETVYSWSGESRSLRVESGYVIVRDGSSSHVLIPGR